MKIACLHCGTSYPDIRAPYRCPNCGGLFDYVEPMRWREVDSTEMGIWRYAASLQTPPPHVTLGEGNTPLVPAQAFGRRVYFKCEYANPTGSFKDRGMAALVSFLVSRGVRQALEDSSGNAGASFAAYAARAGIKARIYIPEAASGVKRKQIEAYGAELVAVPGDRAAVAAAAGKAADSEMAYASHAHMPHNLAGYATCAFEISEELPESPGAIIVPAGQGGLLLGLGRGFRALADAGVIRRIPVIVGVQAAACAPLVAMGQRELGSMQLVSEGETIAEGVRIASPLRADAVLKMVRDSGGQFVGVGEDSIRRGRDALARLGFYVEPTSALVWHALNEVLGGLPDPVVAVLTGSGYKTKAS